MVFASPKLNIATFLALSELKPFSLINTLDYRSNICFEHFEASQFRRRCEIIGGKLSEFTRHPVKSDFWTLRVSALVHYTTRAHADTLKIALMFLYHS